MELVLVMYHLVSTTVPLYTETDAVNGLSNPDNIMGETLYVGVYSTGG